MTKVRIKSEKLTPFGEIFAIMELFNALLSQTIDSTLGLRSKFYGYQSMVFTPLPLCFASPPFVGGEQLSLTSTLISKDNANECNESLLSNCRVQLILCKKASKYNKANL